jgi:hypothetical protein
VRSICERQRRIADQGGVATRRIVVSPKLAKLPFEIATIPEQHVVEEFSAYCPDQAFHERVREGDERPRLDFVDLKNPKVGLPPVRLEQRIVIRADRRRATLPNLRFGVRILNSRSTGSAG